VYTLSQEDPIWAVDGIQLQQAMLNLILNAADALKGKEEGRISISTSVANAGNLMISVADNGRGIPEQDKRKVLDLFFTTKGTKGTGLGLPMVQKFVDRSGGQLQFQSEEGKGSVFTMIFPKTT
jgi:signal transduction histidine kinase